MIIPITRCPAYFPLSVWALPWRCPAGSLIPTFSAVGRPPKAGVRRVKCYTPPGIIGCRRNSPSRVMDAQTVDRIRVQPAMRARPFREHVNVSAVSRRPDSALGDGPGDHARDGNLPHRVHPFKTGALIQAGYLSGPDRAKELGKFTQLSSPIWPEPAAARGQLATPVHVLVHVDVVAVGETRSVRAQAPAGVRTAFATVSTDRLPV